MIRDKVLIKRGKFVDCAIVEHNGEEIQRIVCFEELNYQVTLYEAVNNIRDIIDIEPLHCEDKSKEYFELLLENTQKELVKL